LSLDTTVTPAILFPRPSSQESVHVMRSVARSVAVLVTVAALAPLAQAGQRVTASIEGSVVDETGAPLTGVTITARNRETGLQREVATDENGRFVIVSLPVEGEYELRAEREGFASVVRENVEVLQDQTVTVDFALRVATREGIVVGSPVEPAVDREHSTVRQTVNEPFVRALPLFGRGFIPLASLAAGFTGNPDFPSSQGQAYWTTNILVDGASHFSKWRSAARSFYSGYGLESIKQVQVLTNLFSAEFGEALASVTSVATKAGTNVWHGSGLLFVRDGALDAVPPFAARTPPGGAQQFGASIGGPIRVDRTHVFAAYEGRRARDRNIVVSPAAPNAEVPNDQDEHLLFARLDQQGQRQVSTARYNGQYFRWHHEPGGLTLPGTGTRHETTVHTLLATSALQLSDHALNELRVQFARFSEVRRDLNPRVYVHRAGYSIEGGSLGPSGFGADPEDTWEVADTVSHWAGAHTVRTGGGFKYVRAHNMALPYGHGAYFFAGPPDRFPDPFLFTQALARDAPSTAADPRSVSLFGFIQDDMRIGARLTANLGFRYDVEKVSGIAGVTVPADFTNLQPRVGAAFDVSGNGRTVLRGGVGLYSQQHLLYPLNRAQLDGPSGAITVTLTPDSTLMPRYPAVLPPFLSGQPLPARDVHRLDPALENPYAIQAAAGVQRNVLGGVLSADLVFLRGHDLLSLVDANAPASLQKPGQRTVAEADATRPIVPAPSLYRKIITLGNEGRSWYHALQVKLDRSVGSIQAVGSYTLSRAEDMAGYQLPEDSRNLAADKARASTDIRHNLVVGFTWDLPAARALTRGWSLSGIGVFRSNRPYTISWGDDRNGTTQSDARPGDRNTGKTGSYQTVDLALSRKFRRTLGLIEARVEAFNILNATNYDQYVGELLSPLYARPVSAFPQRRLQLALIARF
jgi:hypothetical protein